MKVTIESKHYAISAIVALALATIALLTWYRSSSISELDTQRETIHHIDTSLHMLHKIHVDFVTLYDTKYLEAFRVKLELINSEIKQVEANLNSLDLDASHLSQISTQLISYSSLFEKIAILQQKIGKDQTEGVRKKMRDALYAIESRLEGIADINIRNTIHRRMLMTQRPEKDLMLRRQDKYLAKFDNFYKLTVDDVEALIDDPKLKSELFAALASYKGFFKQLSGAALEIGLSYEDGLRNQASMAVSGTHVTIDELSKYVNEAISKKESRINSLILFACISFSGLIIIFIFQLTRSIVLPLKEITADMTDLAEGNLDVSILGYERPDEIGNMARALRVFKINAIERDRARSELQQAHNELEKRVEERTKELMNANQHLGESKMKAEAASVAKGNFLANMSHELRTPLNAIIGFSGTLKEEIFGKLNTEKQKEYVNDINLSGMHLLELINDILDVSAIEAGKLELNEENIEINELINDAIRLMAPHAEKRNVSISVSLSDSLPMLYADARRIQQILLNILSNAVKFSNSGEAVTIMVDSDNQNSLSIMVTDVGLGMSDDEIATAMQPFGQVAESSHTRNHEGTGLGLPLVKSLVEMHGGTFEINSKKGAGTNVVVSFPAERIIWDEAATNDNPVENTSVGAP